MKTCTQCGTAYDVTPQEKALYQKFGFPEAEFCLECDHKNRICFRNERALYHRTCDATGQKILSTYSPDKPFKVYKNDVWYGDTWDALEYGQEIDWNRPFYEQLKELQLKVPRPALSTINNENSDYCNMTVGNKNCYLVFGGDYNQDVQYGTLCMHNASSMELDFTERSEWCYFVGDCSECYGCQFVFDSKNCKDSAYLSDCVGCTECIFCTNLSNKSYCIDNQQLSKDAYLVRKKEILMGSHQKRSENWKHFLELRANRIVKFSHQIGCQDCSGDYIKNSKNCQQCYEIADSEDLCNVIFGTKSKDCFRSSFAGDNNELCYNIQCLVKAVNSKFSYWVFESSNIECSDIVNYCHDCFGCVGISHKRHCILNKQYSPEEYKILRQRLIEHMRKTGEWGKSLPKNLSCYGYNETTAQKYFPMTREEALKQGFQWCDVEEKRPEATKVIPANRLPDEIKDIPDDILNWAIECETSKRLFKITSLELKFYRDHKLPIPRQHSEKRHKIRTQLRNPKHLWQRECMKCRKPIQTTYAPERTEIVYCEGCYLKEVY